MELKNYRVIFYTEHEEFSVKLSAEDEERAIFEIDDLLSDSTFIKGHDGFYHKVSTIEKLKIEELEETK